MIDELDFDDMAKQVFENDTHGYKSVAVYNGVMLLKSTLISKGAFRFRKSSPKTLQCRAGII